MASDSSTYTPETIARKLAMAQQLLGDRKKPITHWAEGLDELAKGYFGGKMFSDAETAQKEGDTRSREFIASLLAGGSPTNATGPEVAAPQEAPAQTAQPMGELQGMPRGFRNNNPLNIEAGNFTQGQPGFSGSDGRFAKFASMDQGLGAANKLLDVYQNKHGLNTVAGVLNRWAPASDGNDVNAYAANVAKQLGIDPNAPISPEMRPKLIAAMAQHENGRPLPQGAMPQQMAQAPQGNPMQARIVEALRGKDPFVAKAAQGMAGSLVQKMMTPSDYDIQQRPDGTVIAVNKKNPQDMRVINAPGAGESAIKFEADKAAAVATAKGKAEKELVAPEKAKQEQQVAGVVTQDIDRALKVMETATLPTTGQVGSWLSNIGGTAANDVRALVDTVKANSGFQELNKMRSMSPTGGALGSITERELALLQSTVGNLEQSQTEAQFKDNLRRVKNTYLDVIHGEGKGPPREKFQGSSPVKEAPLAPPKAGEVKDGYRFKGGNPADRNSWERVN